MKIGTPRAIRRRNSGAGRRVPKVKVNDFAKEPIGEQLFSKLCAFPAKSSYRLYYFSMLPPDFVEGVRELIALVKECPEPLQEKCLQLLLEDFLEQSREPSAKTENGKSPDKKPKPAAPAEPTDESEQEETPEKPVLTPGQRDIVVADLHLKAKKFLSQYSVSLEEINQLFFIEDDKVKPLYDDLKSTKASETQVRIGLLQALRAGLKTGEFQFSGEDVRTECQERKAYDAGNFAANFKNSAGLFSGFEKYEKTTPTLRLSEAGKQRLADTIRDLQ